MDFKCFFELSQIFIEIYGLKNRHIFLFICAITTRKKTKPTIAELMRNALSRVSQSQHDGAESSIYIPILSVL